MKTVQTVLFVFLMAGASWWDIRKRIFPDHYVLLLILAALISFDPCKFTGILAAIPFLLTALWIGGIGGGDIKFVAVSGLVLGFGRTFVGVYADEGITGTSTKKRDDFKRLIRDCMAGRIDLIITKSISRFARNTLDCLMYVRKLKEIGVAVYFEKENLNTMDENSEMVLTILSSLAQEESRSISTNVHWGIAKRYEKGEVRVNTNRFLGFTRNEQHDLIPDNEEAITVRRIFRYYYEGNSVGVIKKRMEEEGFETGAGKKQWWASVIDRILDNEKYMGDALLQKTYTVDFLTKKRVKNTGQLNQYYVTDCVDALIPKKIYFKVQEMKAEKKTLGDRSSKLQNQVKGRRKSKYVLSDILVCAECGHYYRRVPWTNRQGEKRYVWRCINRLEHGTEYCKKFADD